MPSAGRCSLRRIRVKVPRRPTASGSRHSPTFLHEGNNGRALTELEAELVAFVVRTTLGIDSSDYYFGYVAGWSGGGDEVVSRIKSVGGRIQGTADRILA
jgi:hypothetical protein